MKKVINNHFLALIVIITDYNNPVYYYKTATKQKITKAVNIMEFADFNLE